jgi:hypothetical protein
MLIIAILDRLDACLFALDFGDLWRSNYSHGSSSYLKGMALVQTGYAEQNLLRKYTFFIYPLYSFEKTYRYSTWS